jgi:dCTP deaminase
MFLNKSTIEEMVKNQPNFISPFDPALLKPASYTFRLGGIHGQSGEISQVIIQPGQFILLETMESISFPDDIVGILSTRGSIAQLGIDALFTSTIIEPGSQGKTILETKNHSEKEVILKIGQPIVKCLFSKVG